MKDVSDQQYILINLSAMEPVVQDLHLSRQSTFGCKINECTMTRPWILENLSWVSKDQLLLIDSTQSLTLQPIRHLLL